MTKITLTRMCELAAEKGARDAEADLIARARTASHALSKDYNILDDLIDRITHLETKLREILTDATSLPHALTIAREGLHGEGGE